MQGIEADLFRCIRNVHPSMNDGMLNLIFAAVEAEPVGVKIAEASVV